MVCYDCERPGVAECVRCTRAFCAQHGAAVCAECSSPANVFPSAALYRTTVGASAALLLLAGAYVMWWPELSPGQTRMVLASNGTGVRPGPENPSRAQAQGGGNAPADAPPAPTVVPTPEPPRKYSVAAGDTLLGIALRHDTTVDELMRLNGLTDASSLSIGQELLVAAPAATSGPASADSAPQRRTHTVASGDTPLGIALRHDITVDELYRLNGLTESSLLRIGQELVISVGPTPTPEPASSPTPVPQASATPTVSPTPAPAQQRTYAVAPGDTLYAIARRFGITDTELMRLNGITDPGSLQIGQELTIAVGASASSGTPAPRQHTVVSGDTLVELASRYGTTVDELVRLNGLADPTSLNLGQELTLP